MMYDHVCIPISNCDIVQFNFLIHVDMRIIFYTSYYTLFKILGYNEM